MFWKNEPGVSLGTALSCASSKLLLSLAVLICPFCPRSGDPAVRGMGTHGVPSPLCKQLLTLLPRPVSPLPQMWELRNSVLLGWSTGWSGEIQRLLSTRRHDQTLPELGGRVSTHRQPGASTGEQRGLEAHTSLLVTF